MRLSTKMWKCQYIEVTALPRRETEKISWQLLHVFRLSVKVNKPDCLNIYKFGIAARQKLIMGSKTISRTDSLSQESYIYIIIL